MHEQKKEYKLGQSIKQPHQSHPLYSLIPIQKTSIGLILPHAESYIKLSKKQVCSDTLKTRHCIFCCLASLYHLPSKWENLSLPEFSDYSVWFWVRVARAGPTLGMWYDARIPLGFALFRPRVRCCPSHWREDSGAASASCVAWC